MEIFNGFIIFAPTGSAVREYLAEWDELWEGMSCEWAVASCIEFVSIAT